MALAPPSPADLAFPPLPYTTLHQPGHGNGPSHPGGDVVSNSKSPRYQATMSSAVLEASDLPCLAPGGRSFAEATKAGIFGKRTATSNRFPTIQLAARQYGLKDGKPSVSFSQAELQVGVDFLRHTLVAKFSSGRPPIENIRSAFTAAWCLDKCSIGALDARHILVVLDSEQEARKVLAHPNRKLGHSYFRIFRWTKDFSTKKESSTTSTWIRLMNLPPEMTNQGYIETIVSSFSRFLAVDVKTATLVNPCYARVCIEVDTTKTLPDQVWINTGREAGFWQQIVYENRLLFCTKCKIHGHSLETCRKAIKRRLENQRIWEGRDEHGLPIAQSLSTVAASITGETTTIAVTTQNGPAINGNKSNSSKERGEWVEVRRRKGIKTVRFSDKDASKNLAPNSLAMESVDEWGKLDTSNAHLGDPINSVSTPPDTVVDAANSNLCSGGEGSPIAACANLPVQTLGAKLPSLVQSDSGMANVGQSAKDNENISLSGNNENEVVDIPQFGNNENVVVDIPHGGNNENEVTNVKSTIDHPIDPGTAVVTYKELGDDGHKTHPNVPGGTAEKSILEVINEDFESSDLQIPEEFAQKISSYGSELFDLEGMDGPADARAIYLHFRHGCEEDKIIFEFLDDTSKKKRQVNQEGSGIPIGEAERGDDHQANHNIDNELCDQDQMPTIAIQQNNRRGKKKKSRSSARACPKHKDTNFVWS